MQELEGNADFQSMIQAFQVFRAYICHEDELINQRVLWNINLEAFLVATYGYSVQKLIEIHDKAGVYPVGSFALHTLILVIPILGFVISVASALGVSAAKRAILRLYVQWERVKKERYSQTQYDCPSLIGGGCTKEEPPEFTNRPIHEDGLRAPLWFPRAFMLFWPILLLSYVGSYCFFNLV